jgi:bifunctional oligoribonuclease and PAP phosphatase NrnA
MNCSFKEIATAIRQADTIVIVSHMRPDGDAIGSQLALGLALQQTEKEVTAWNEDGVPSSLSFLSGSNLITHPPKSFKEFDLAIAVDTASQQRLGTSLHSIKSAKQWINIDHHASNPGYGDLNYIDSTAPATGEIIYEFLSQQNFPFSIETATALFVAISTDTGSFRFPNTRASTLDIAADLVRRGVNLGKVTNALYENYPKRRMILLGDLLHEARFDATDQIASMSLTLQTKKQLGVKMEDIDGLIDSIRSIESVLVALFFEELEDGKIRLSMRSKDTKYDVNKFCSEFGGGGHALAAGARIRGTLDVVRSIVLEKITHEITKSV